MVFSNTITLIFLLAAAHGIVLAAALFFSGKKANRLMGVLAAVLSLALLHNAVLTPTGYYAQPGAFPVWLLFSLLLVPPLFYFYVYFSVWPERPWRSRYWWFFAPALSIMAIFLVSHLGGIFLGKAVIPPRLVQWFGKMEEPLAIAATLIVIHQVWKMIRNYHRRIEATFSEVHDIRLHWLQRLILLSLLASLIWTAVIPIEKFSNGRIVFPEIVYHSLWLIQSIIIFIIGYKAYRFPEVFRHDDAAPANAAVTEEEERFAHYDDEKALEKLTAAMERKHLHRRAKLSLKELADDLELPARYVSFLINRHRQTNFHDFVNAYRVEEIIRRMNDERYAHYTLLALGLEAGFNSKSSFNYGFKKHTGKSPSAFRKDRTG